ncbi:MAG: outer membrane receptor protein involved in Fe transport [Myxococcota bacterium]|jgi:outer membrane receptor protein involved in Fe transport
MCSQIPLVTVVTAVTIALGTVLGSMGTTHALAPEPDVLDADDPTVSDDLGAPDFDLTASGPSDEDLVLAAQKVRTTIQEAPSIIFVVTRKQIVERGYRTVNDVIRSVPGFEGDRWEGNGWQRENIARGLPRTILVLLNGVNIVEPLRNFTSLDRKIPLEIVERIEITSGPGGVLWGSNALLGVVNIVTRRPDDGGLEALAGFGDGPGDRLQLKGALGYSKRVSELVSFYVHANFYSTEGPELTVDSQKIIGSLPAPAPDSPTLYLPGPLTLTTGKRSWFFNFAGRLEVGPVALDWMIPFEADYRAIATGGAPLTTDYLDPNGPGRPTDSADSIRVIQLSYQDRFSNDTMGVSARAYLVEWDLKEDPFGVYPASPVIFANFGHTEDLHLAFNKDAILRPGLALDFDFQLSDAFTLLAGAEGFLDYMHGVTQASWASDVEGECPDGFVFDALDPYLPCKIEEPLVSDAERLIGGAFVQAEWRALPRLTLSAGTRLQLSTQFDPTLLWSAGAVWNPVDRWHLKLFASTGLRPPGFVSTNTRDTTSGISFKANPNLNAETSRSYELEVNTMLLQDVGEVRDLYLRASGAFTQMSNVIGRPGGVFQNSGEQEIVSAEAFARLRFQGGHELWANYTYTRVFDDSVPGGEITNFANHMFNVGARVSFLNDSIELDGILTFKGPMTDRNRPPLYDPSRPDYSLSCDAILSGGFASDFPLRQLCAFDSLSEGVWVLPGTDVAERIEPVVLLDVGIRFKNLWEDLTLAVFVHNLFDSRYFEPDLFSDPRVLSRPQPKPGMSIFGQISIGL